MSKLESTKPPEYHPADTKEIRIKKARKEKYLQNKLKNKERL